MRISTFTVLVTATLAGLGVALPGEEAFELVRRSTPDHYPPPRPLPPRPGPPPDRPLPPIPQPRPPPRPQPDAVSRHYRREPDHEFEIFAREFGADLYERDAGEDFELYKRALGEDYMDFVARDADPEVELMDWE